MTLHQSEFSNMVYLSKSLGYDHTLEIIELIPEKFPKDKIPSFIHYNRDGEIVVNEPTPLTDGELKEIVLMRRVMHIHLLESSQAWHCFFFTFRDIQGEHWSDCHLHYISSLWGKSKESTLIDLRGRSHNVRSEHVKFVQTPLNQKVLTLPKWEEAKKIVFGE